MIHAIDNRLSLASRNAVRPLVFAEPAASAAPALRHNCYYLIRFQDSVAPQGASEFVELLHFVSSGGIAYWIGPNDNAYAEGPLTVEEADYEVFAKSPRVSSHAPSDASQAA